VLYLLSNDRHALAYQHALKFQPKEVNRQVAYQHQNLIILPPHRLSQFPAQNSAQTLGQELILHSQSFIPLGL